MPRIKWEMESLLDIIRRAQPIVERAEWGAELEARDARHAPARAAEIADRLAQARLVLRDMRAVLRADRTPSTTEQEDEHAG